MPLDEATFIDLLAICAAGPDIAQPPPAPPVRTRPLGELLLARELVARLGTGDREFSTPKPRLFEQHFAFRAVADNAGLGWADGGTKKSRAYATLSRIEWGPERLSFPGGSSVYRFRRRRTDESADDYETAEEYAAFLAAERAAAQVAYTDELAAVLVDAAALRADVVAEIGEPAFDALRTPYVTFLDARAAFAALPPPQHGIKPPGYDAAYAAYNAALAAL